MLELGVLTLNWMQSLLLPLTRVGAFLISAPVFGQPAAGGRIRIVYAATITLVMLPSLPQSILEPGLPYGEPTLLLLLSEALLGVSMGLAMQFVAAAVVTAGEHLSVAVGLGFAQSFDPTIGSTPVLAQFLNLFALLVFLSSGGHVAVISMISESIRVMPPGQFRLSDITALLEFSGVIFKGAALLAGPMLFALLAVNLGVGALSRATPSLNVFAVGFSVSLLVGFGMLFLLIPVMGERMADLWVQAQEFVRSQLLKGP